MFRASLNGRFIASVAAITTSELSGLDYKVAPSTVWQILKDAGIGPAPTRSGYTGRAFLTGQAKTILAVGFFHVDTVFLRRLFNSVQFATDPVAALKHMSHVTRPGGLISFLVWGPPDKCQSGVIFAELGPMTPHEPGSLRSPSRTYPTR
jgi:SAM-dependent methyltransferase